MKLVFPLEETWVALNNKLKPFVLKSLSMPRVEETNSTHRRRAHQHQTYDCPTYDPMLKIFTENTQFTHLKCFLNSFSPKTVTFSLLKSPFGCIFTTENESHSRFKDTILP